MQTAQCFFEKLSDERVIQRCMPHQQPKEQRPINHIEHNLYIGIGPNLPSIDRLQQKSAPLFPPRQNKMIAKRLGKFRIAVRGGNHRGDVAADWRSEQRDHFS